MSTAPKRCLDGIQGTQKGLIAIPPREIIPSKCNVQPITADLRALQDSRQRQHQSWLKQLNRLENLQLDLALLPVGWGSEYKGPMLEKWQEHPGFTIPQLQDTYGIKSVGARTGMFTGPLLAFDWDGETSVDYTCELGLAPWALQTWHVHRSTDPWRLKALTQPTVDQISQLPVNADGSVEFTLKLPTKAKEGDRKGEALEVFFHGGRQVVVLGNHPSSGGYYYWPTDLGPEALSAPPDDWWQAVVAMAQAQHQRTAKASPRSTNVSKSGTKRLDPCPICGRHSGKGGSALWCDETTDGLIFCMGGSTFNAEHSHGSLTVGESVVNGYRLTKRTITSQGDDCFVFAPVKEVAHV